LIDHHEGLGNYSGSSRSLNAFRKFLRVKVAGIQIWPKVVLRHAGILLDREHLLSWQFGLPVNPFPDSRLADTPRARRGRLRSVDCYGTLD
jgi:hypothetical protein